MEIQVRAVIEINALQFIVRCDPQPAILYQEY